MSTSRNISREAYMGKPCALKSRVKTSLSLLASTHCVRLRLGTMVFAVEIKIQFPTFLPELTVEIIITEGLIFFSFFGTLPS